MCVIVYKPRDVEIDMKVLYECWESNSDGAGLMFAEDGKLKVAKGFMKWRSLKRYIKKTGINRLNALPICFHFRIATHGTVTERNCHPFSVDENMAMAHNGVISGMSKYIDEDEDVSDSEMFLRRYVRDAFSILHIKNMQKGEPINDLFASFIGANKLLFMDNDGEVAIVNETQGSWPKAGLGEGMWFSNTHWKPWPKPAKSPAYTPTTHKGYGFGSYVKGAAFIPANGHVAAPKNGNSTNAKPATGLLTHGTLAWNESTDEWYCFECHSFFALGEARRSYWTNGMKDRIVDCPECGSPQTTESTGIFDDEREELRSQTPVSQEDAEEWTCYDCYSDFYEGDSELATVNGDARYQCPYCKGFKTYKDEYVGLVDRFGDAFFSAETIDITKGGADAEK